MNQRLMLYRQGGGGAARRGDRAACSRRCATATARCRIRSLNLADYGRIRVMADRLGIESIDREGRIVVLKFRPQAKMDPAWLFRVDPGAEGRPADAAGDPEAGSCGSGRVGPGLPSAQSQKGSGQAASWWTARATAGEVNPGFTRDEILRPAKEDPRAEGGVFSRVSGLLRDLSEGVQIR